jgi:predicted DNA-binding transcriptional regulator AlpA
MVLEKLREIPVTLLAKHSGVSRSEIYRILNGACYPQKTRLLLRSARH